MSGFVRFDPDAWEAPDPAANPAKVAKGGDGQPDTLASLAALAGVHAAGVQSLDSNLPPCDVDPREWSRSVRDAARLLETGWVAPALGLGWSALDLFGAVTDPQGDPNADGLAVKLSGRKVLAICASFATVADTNGGRSYIYRRSSDGAVLLWALARGR